MKCALLDSDQRQPSSQCARRNCTKMPADNAVTLPSLDCLDSPRGQPATLPAKSCLPRLPRDSCGSEVRFALIVALVAAFIGLV